MVINSNDDPEFAVLVILVERESCVELCVQRTGVYIERESA